MSDLIKKIDEVLTEAPKQEVKIINTKDDSSVFFFAHSFKTARQHADVYIKRNTGKFPMKVYELSNKPKPSPKWILIKEA